MATAHVKTTFKATVNRAAFYRVQAAIFEMLEDAVDRTLSYGVQVAKKHAPVRKVTRRGGRVSTRGMTDAEIADLPDDILQAISLANTWDKTGARPRVTTKRSLAGYEKPGVRVKGKTVSRAKQGGKARDVLINPDTGERTMRFPAMAALLSSRGKRELEGGRRRSSSGTNLDGVYIKGISAIERVKRRNPVTGKTESFDRTRHGYRATLGGRLKDEIRAHLDTVSAGVVSGELVSPTAYARYVEFPTSRTAAQPYMRPARDAMEARLPKEIDKALTRVSQMGGG